MLLLAAACSSGGLLLASFAPPEDCGLGKAGRSLAKRLGAGSVATAPSVSSREGRTGSDRYHGYYPSPGVGTGPRRPRPGPAPAPTSLLHLHSPQKPTSIFIHQSMFDAPGCGGATGAVPPPPAGSRGGRHAGAAVEPGVRAAAAQARRPGLLPNALASFARLWRVGTPACGPRLAVRGECGLHREWRNALTQGRGGAAMAPHVARQNPAALDLLAARRAHPAAPADQRPLIRQLHAGAQPPLRYSPRHC